MFFFFLVCVSEEGKTLPVNPDDNEDKPVSKKKPRKCRFFKSKSGCKDGDTCLFRHGPTSEKPTPIQPKKKAGLKSSGTNTSSLSLSIPAGTNISVVFGDKAVTISFDYQ